MFHRPRPILRAAVAAGAVTVFAVVLTSGLPGCGKGPGADERFVALVGRYLDGMLELNPVWATNLGDHRFDDRLAT